MQARIDALTGVSAIVAQHATSCSVDGDCIVVDTSLPCQDSCASTVLTARAVAFRSELDQYATSVCPTLPLTCGFGPSCAQVTEARCLAGTCRPVLAAMGP
jgi:hypothetical protein